MSRLGLTDADVVPMPNPPSARANMAIGRRRRPISVCRGTGLRCAYCAGGRRVRRDGNCDLSPIVETPSRDVNGRTRKNPGCREFPYPGPRTVRDELMPLSTCLAGEFKPPSGKTGPRRVMFCTPAVRRRPPEAPPYRNPWESPWPSRLRPRAPPHRREPPGPLAR